MSIQPSPYSQEKTSSPPETQLIESIYKFLHGKKSLTEEHLSGWRQNHSHKRHGYATKELEDKYRVTISLNSLPLLLRRIFNGMKLDNAQINKLNDFVELAQSYPAFTESYKDSLRAYDQPFSKSSIVLTKQTTNTAATQQPASNIPTSNNNIHTTTTQPANQINEMLAQAGLHDDSVNDNEDTEDNKDSDNDNDVIDKENEDDDNIATTASPTKTPDIVDQPMPQVKPSTSGYNPETPAFQPTAVQASTTANLEQLLGRYRHIYSADQRYGKHLAILNTHLEAGTRPTHLASNRWRMPVVFFNDQELQTAIEHETCRAYMLTTLDHIQKRQQTKRLLLTEVTKQIHSINQDQDSNNKQMADIRAEIELTVANHAKKSWNKVSRITAAEPNNTRQDNYSTHLDNNKERHQRPLRQVGHNHRTDRVGPINNERHQRPHRQVENNHRTGRVEPINNERHQRPHRQVENNHRTGRVGPTNNERRHYQTRQTEQDNYRRRQDEQANRQRSQRQIWPNKQIYACHDKQESYQRHRIISHHDGQNGIINPSHRHHSIQSCRHPESHFVTSNNHGQIHSYSHSKQSHTNDQVVTENHRFHSIQDCKHPDRHYCYNNQQQQHYNYKQADKRTVTPSHQSHTERECKHPDQHYEYQYRSQGNKNHTQADKRTVTFSHLFHSEQNCKNPNQHYCNYQNDNQHTTHSIHNTPQNSHYNATHYNRRPQ
jgi:hypothetical protein